MCVQCKCTSVMVLCAGVTVSGEENKQEGSVLKEGRMIWA